MQPLSAPPASSFAQAVRRKRHALLGTGCALGLILAPLAGSAVVFAVTGSPVPAVVAAPAPAQLATAPAPAVVAAPVPVQPATSPTPVSAEPVRDAHRARAGR
jgi:hypothetical protein